MGNFEITRNNTIKSVLEKFSRQYLAGNLKKEQELQFYNTRDLEIGITKYNNHSVEKPHYHTIATEFQYVISGYTKYLDIDNNIEYEFKKGDFYLIKPNTKYAQKSKKNTEILFIKTPSINDKTLLKKTKEVEDWLRNSIVSERKDYYYEPNSPIPNSIVPAASVAIKKENKILMIKRSDNGLWTLPGGTLNFGESLEECIIRETKEETNTDIKNLELFNIYSNPKIKIEYSDGEVRQEFTVVYTADFLQGEVKIDHESKEFKWVDLEHLNDLNMTESQQLRIKDLIRKLSN